MKKTLGIIGFGKFSQLMIDYLHQDFDVFVSSRSKHEVADQRFEFAEVDQVLNCDFVVPAIPAQFLEDFMQTHKSKLKGGNVFIDVTSVKKRPLEILEQYLPESVELIGTHPIFGPGSAKYGLAGQRIAAINVNAKQQTYDQLIAYLKLHGLIVVETTVQEHDYVMAYVLGLTQLIGRAAQQMGIPDTELTTDAYKSLVSMRDIQGNDSWELFESIIGSGDDMITVLDEFIETATELKDKVDMWHNGNGKDDR